MPDVETKPVVECINERWRGTWADTGYCVFMNEYDNSRKTIARAELEVYCAEVYLDTLTVDLLSPRGRVDFGEALGARNGIGPAVWDDYLRDFHRAFREQQALRQTTEDSPWIHAQTMAEFLNQEDDAIDATVKDFLIPGCTTVVSAPRGSGKTFVALFLGLALAQGGIFRMERLARQRVLLVDRDNAPALIRQRLRNLGADGGLTGFKVLTRETAPPLTNAAAWAIFPAEDYDVLIVDSLSAFTEGVSEKEGKQTQEFVAILKDLAGRGLAILALANTTKDGTNIRGRGEQTNAVDIVYEARNITGWEPDDGPYWWESLPEAGEQAWQQNTTRHMQGNAMRIGFVPTKFRMGIQPPPFVLEMDTTTTPYSMTDVTVQLTQEATEAVRARKSAELRKLEEAAAALVTALQTRPAEGGVMLKKGALDFLRAHGPLTARQARNLLENGYNHDLHHDGLWVLREITGGKGHPVGVYLVADDPLARAGEEKIDVRNNGNPAEPHKTSSEETPISYTGLPGGVQNTTKSTASKTAVTSSEGFRTPIDRTCTKSAPVSPAENLDETDRPDFVHDSPTPASAPADVREHVHEERHAAGAPVLMDGLIAGVFPPLLPASCPGCGRQASWLIRSDHYECAPCQYKWTPSNNPRRM
jgi:hypothetical protein